MSNPLDNLCGPGKPLQLEAPEGLLDVDARPICGRPSADNPFSGHAENVIGAP